MDYINHITLNTGHCTKSYPNETDRVMYPYLKEIYEEMFNDNGAVINDGFVAKGYKQGKSGIVIKIYCTYTGAHVLTSFITKNNNNRVWKKLHSKVLFPLKTHSMAPPKPPYIADRIEVGALLHSEAMLWTGSFIRCMGWFIISPDTLKEESGITTT